MEIANHAKEYKSSDHLVYSCQYHVIFCPKYRKPILTGDVERRFRELAYEAADKHAFQIVELETMPDHVHMIIDCNPRFGIMECVRKIRTHTASNLKVEFEHLTRTMPNIWTRSAFISTVGSVSLDIVKKYIANQKGV
jgi:putative transposase